MKLEITLLLIITKILSKSIFHFHYYTKEHKIIESNKDKLNRMEKNCKECRNYFNGTHHELCDNDCKLIEELKQKIEYDNKLQKKYALLGLDAAAEARKREEAEAKRKENIADTQNFIKRFENSRLNRPVVVLMCTRCQNHEIKERFSCYFGCANSIGIH